MDVQHRHPRQVLWVSFEELAQDPAQVVRRVAEFLDTPPLDAETLRRIVERASFVRMKADHERQMAAYERATGDSTRVPGATPHFRRGLCGGWRELFDAELSQTFDAAYARRLEGSGLRYDSG